MKILWITNMLFPEANSVLLGKNTELSGSGGWLVSAAENLLHHGEVELVVAAPSNLVKELTKITGKNIIYYALPCDNERKYKRSFENLWKNIVTIEKPAIVHIHGTEFSHGLAFLRTNITIPTILSIQGISEEIGNHYLDGISTFDIYRNITLFDLLYSGSLLKQQKEYIKHGKNVEHEMIRSVKHIIGRTTFDKSHAVILNPDVQYYSCNEILRNTFYDGSTWNYDTCKPHTIFLSQSTYPIKGLHQLLKAMPFILKEFPDTKVRIAGSNIFSSDTLKQRLVRSSYVKYIGRLIKKLGLQNHIQFTGPLNADQMKKEYLNCNIFVCPSSIENSPNSLAEAQILGVPCVASFVGGIPDMIPNKNHGVLYRFSDSIMLAYAVCEVFSSKWESKEQVYEARNRHCVKTIVQDLLAIYDSLINEHDRSDK